MKHDHISFQDYNMDQLYLPMDLEVEIPTHHVCRIVNRVVEELDENILYRCYDGGGRPPYHPKMMLKIILYAYTQKIYSSRQIAKQLKENIYFMWLARHQQPDFRTINRFRSEKMKEIIYEIFFSIVDLLRNHGLVKLEDYFLDGTKVEANANKYTFVWRKATERYDSQLNEKYHKIMQDIEKVTRQDEDHAGELDEQEKLEADPITSEDIKQSINELEEKLAEEPKNREVKKAKRLLEKDLLPRKERYETQKEILNGRNSYSKTDTDASFMRMKDDHMRNGQLKPGYNVQTGTENQFITGFSLHQRAGDPGCLKPHFDLLEKYGRRLPNNLIADSGYGSEENYSFCKEKKIEAYVKYSTLDKEQTKKFKDQIGRVENLQYDEEEDEWICANNKRLTFQYNSNRKTENGYTTIKRVYRCVDCHGCPFQEVCAKGKDTKTISVSMKNQEQRRQVRERLQTETGSQLYRRRKCDVEPVFGQIKYNRGFNRFYLRGLSKTTLEWGLLCIAHNFLKWETHLRLKEQKEIKREPKAG
jgi:transposase